MLYRSVYKMEPASLENAEIRFLSSWLYFYFSACLGIRLIHIYLWFMQILLLFWNLADFDKYGVVFLGVYIFNFCPTDFWVYLSSEIYVVLILVFCVICEIYFIFVRKKCFLFLNSKLYHMIFSSFWSHQAFLEYFGFDQVFFRRKVSMGLL